MVRPLPRTTSITTPTSSSPWSRSRARAGANLADTNGGTDWIDAATVTGNVALNLASGATVNGIGWFTIAGGTLIENAVTGDGNDSLNGTSAANKLYGMRGNDTIFGQDGDDTVDGGAGDDTAIFTGALASYTPQDLGSRITLSGLEGSDTLFGPSTSPSPTAPSMWLTWLTATRCSTPCST